MSHRLNVEALCWSSGPRIGAEDDRPRCKRERGHEGPHQPDPEDGWGRMQWGDPTLRVYPSPR